MKENFEEVASLWCAHKQKIVKHSTFCAYRLVLHSHLLPRFAEHTEITEAVAQQFLLEKIEAGLAKKTVKDIMAVLKAVVKFGRRHQLFAYEGWELSYPTDIESPRVPTLSLANQRRLLSHLVEKPSSKNIGILLALSTGMRIGEICGLRWENVNFSERVIKVCQTVGRIYNCDTRATERVASSPKTRNSYREIPMSQLLFRTLKCVRKSTTSEFVVGGKRDSTEPRAYRDYYNRLLRRLDIPHIRFHGLRHTFATRCVESQGDYKTISALLGHSNVATTLNLYVHPNLDQKKRCIERMSKFVGLAP